MVVTFVCQEHASQFSGVFLCGKNQTLKICSQLCASYEFIEQLGEAGLQRLITNAQIMLCFWVLTCSSST
eukprot:c17738_g1_i2 orf=621-830(-)